VSSDYTGVAGSDVKAVKIAKPPAANVAPIVVSKAANSETEPSVAWGGSSHYVTWLGSRDAQPGLWGARLGADAQPQAPTKLVSDAKYTVLSRPPRAEVSSSSPR